ncbi:U-box domain-containing protein 62-like isoform X2 [Salvia miltiorrhiza]|uniref:U-box domain-containing protein 62-like isoform X2 n=1 Tax=Salvia miltiorrhiza TaxID=226208 RepID=UPI0025AC594E|nr:U-box domain-containing protein 62-like isoform X2 [Salvia miltiorrhiza]
MFHRSFPTQDDVVDVSSRPISTTLTLITLPNLQLPLKTLILMASEKLGMVPTQQIHNGLNQHPQLVFPEAFACAPQPPHRRPAATGDPGPKAATRELTACFLDHHHYFHPQPQQQQQPPPQPSQFRHQWNANSRSSGGDATEDDDAEDDDDDGDDGDDEEEEEVGNNMENIVTVAKACGSNQKDRYSVTVNSNSHKLKHISALGFKDGNMRQCGNKTNLRSDKSGEVYYSQYLNGAEGPSTSSGQKDIPTAENGCGFSGSKEGSYLSESGDSLRATLLDPLTGTLMEEAMILPCGHSFGSDGIQQVIRMKACYTCSQPVSEDVIAPNLSLRLAVQAFIREEESHINYMPKRRRERYDLKGTFLDSMLTDQPRGKGVQFPFAVMDRVIIKGNKRTPQRFVGREAIVTTQCLNGWYVVKTLDNAESVKLQYRSLAKVSESPSSKPSPIKTTPNWL